LVIGVEGQDIYVKAAEQGKKIGGSDRTSVDPIIIMAAANTTP